jgi:membrane protein implicated in regulation of membrane protease activity
MFIFLAIMGAAIILALGGALFGHDHDVGDHDHDFHDGSGEHDGTISIFSTKVVSVFIMGFGGGGAIAEYYGHGWVRSSLVGLGVGFVMGAVMYAVLSYLFGHQANSLVYSHDLVGRQGIVTIPIEPGAVGEVNVSCGDRILTYLARTSAEGKALPKGSTIEVVSSAGNQLLVKAAN